MLVSCYQIFGAFGVFHGPWFRVSDENDSPDDALLFYMMSLRSAPEWFWIAPEWLSKQYIYRLASVMKMMFPVMPYLLYMILDFMWENTPPGTKFPRIFCASIVPLQFGVLCLFYIRLGCHSNNCVFLHIENYICSL